MIDSDVWPYKNLLDCVDFDKDVISFPVPIYRKRDKPPIVMNVTPWDAEQKTVALGGEDRGLMRIKRGGGSAMLIARRVFDAMSRPVWSCDFDEDGLVSMDEDIKFFDACHELGFEVWTALDYPCAHVKQVDLVEMSNAVKEWR